MQTLLTDIEAFCERHKLSKWDFGAMALNDRPFVGQLENGRRVWPETEAKVRNFMAAYQPEADAA